MVDVMIVSKMAFKYIIHTTACECNIKTYACKDNEANGS